MVFEKTFSYWWSVAQESPESARADPKSSLAGRGAAFALDRTNSRTMSAVEVFVCSKIRRAWAGSCKETVTHTYIYIYKVYSARDCLSQKILQNFSWNSAGFLMANPFWQDGASPETSPRSPRNRGSAEENLCSSSFGSDAEAMPLDVAIFLSFDQEPASGRHPKSARGVKDQDSFGL